MITLRPEEKKDSSFIEQVYRSTREAELDLTNWPEEQKKAFVLMQSMAQLYDYRKNFPGAIFEIISFNKQNAGRLYTCENDTEIRVIDITILPRFRNKGIGTTILTDLLKRSHKVKKIISLNVDPVNPALHLYLRLGFIHIKNNGRHYYMEREPL